MTCILENSITVFKLREQLPKEEEYQLSSVAVSIRNKQNEEIMLILLITDFEENIAKCTKNSP